MSKQDRKSDDHRQTVGVWLKERPYKWRIPVYQRHYAWNAKDNPSPIDLFWATVKKQTEQRLDGKTPDQHYLGAVIVDNKTEIGRVDGIIRYDVVDGQQRLTTIQIALLALAEVARDDYHCGNEIWEKLEGCVFCKKKEPRLQPTNFDRDWFKKVLSDASGKDIDLDEVHVSKENAKKSKIMAACSFFKDAINDVVESHAQREPREVIEKILDSILDGFDLVLIILSEYDDAQGIFESLNSYAKPLTAFDLIRNHVFRRAANEGRKEGNPKKDMDLFKSTNWQKLENPYWQKSAGGRGANKETHIEAYTIRMLGAKTDKDFLVARDDIFKIYKEFSADFSSAEEEVESLGRYTSAYQHLDQKSKGSSILSGIDCGVFYHSVWNSRNFYPVIFLIADVTSNEEKERMIKLLESYVIRRGVCGLTTKDYNNHAITICRKLAETPTYKGLMDALTSAEANTTLFPNDEEVIKRCHRAVFYGSPFQYYVFKKLELRAAGDGSERGDFDVQSIDHALPQGWRGDSESEWSKALQGREDEVDDYVDTIGNLTPMSTKRNSQKSNRSWGECREILKNSPMTLNRDLAKRDAWGIDEIKLRSEELAKEICKIWPYDIQ